jgi:glucuronate isomerase
MAGQDNAILHEDRFFDPDPGIRAIARELYGSVRSLPIISPHGHVDPRLFVTDEPFRNPTDLIITPDHYIFRMLYSQGIPLESLGIPTRDGSPVETDPKKIWKIFGEHYHLFRGTPTAAWLAHEFSEVFGVREKLNAENASRVYECIDEKLRLPEFRPRALFKRFNLEVLSTTDAATDPLDHHRRMRESGWDGRVIPCFRPDGVTDLLTPGWLDNIRRLGELVHEEISSYDRFVRAMEDRRAAFKQLGAVSTDHGVVSPYTHALTLEESRAIFTRALRGTPTAEDAAAFTAHILMEMARMSVEDGLVMQIHPGSMRNHNRALYERFGPDKGGDIPLRTEFTKNLSELLNRYGNDRRLRVIVFTLDESTYARELAPLAGHYPAMTLGPPWWFHDSIEGMKRFRAMTTETAGIYNTAGFNDDTRAFVSIPARHDLSRRIDANFLAGLVSRHMIEMNEAFEMANLLAYGLAKQTYRL